MWSVVTLVADHDEAARALDVRHRPARAHRRRSTAGGARRSTRRPTRRARPRAPASARQRSSPVKTSAYVRGTSRRCTDVGDRRLSTSSRRRPEVAQEDVLAVGALAERLGRRGRRRSGRRARRRRRAAARRGSSPSPPGGCAPRSCGSRRGRRRRRGRPRRPPRRSARAAGPSCRCRSCSRSRPSGTRARRGTAAGRRARSSRSRPSSRARGCDFTHGLPRQAALDRLLREQAGARSSPTGSRCSCSS